MANKILYGRYLTIGIIFSHYFLLRITQGKFKLDVFGGDFQSLAYFQNKRRVQLSLENVSELIHASAIQLFRFFSRALFYPEAI